MTETAQTESPSHFRCSRSARTICTGKGENLQRGVAHPASRPGNRPARHLLIGALATVLLSIFCTGAAPGGDLLTPEERAWLAKNQDRLVLAVETGYAPFVFTDTNGQTKGLAHDFMHLVEEKLGTHFRERRFSSLDDIFQKVRSGEVQVVNAVTPTPWRRTFLSFTGPYISVPNVIIVRKDRFGALREEDLPGLRISLVKNYAVTEYLTGKGIKFTPDLVSDDLSALYNVSFGRSDAAVIDLATASWLITTKGITNLQVAGESAYSIRLAMATTTHEPELNRILQKGLAAVTDEEREAIHRKWIEVSSPGLLSDRRFWAIAGCSLVVVLAILGGILTWNRVLRKQVTLRTRALTREKETLREERWRLQNIIEGTHVGTWEWNLQTGEIILNDIMAQFMGHSLQELTPFTAEARWEHTHPEDRERSRQLLERHLKGELPHYESECRMRHRDGTWVWIHICGTIMTRSSDGRPLMMFGTGRDITLRKRSEETLRTSEERYRLLFENMTSGFVLHEMVLDPQGHAVDFRFLEINPAFGTITGIPVAGLVGKTLRQIRPGIDPWEIAIYEEVVKSGLSRNFINHAVDVGRYYSILAFRPTTAQLAIIFNDVTDQMEARRQLALLNQELEQRIRERTGLLEAANRELESFTYSVSHDLRGPLRAIDGFSRILVESCGTNLKEEDTLRLGRIRENAQRMGQLIDDLLRLSRLSRSELNPSMVDLKEVARTIEKELREAEPERSVEFVVSSGGEVQADAGLMRILMENLLRNAWKFTSKHPTARIEFGSFEHEGETVHYVKDDGAGFDMSYAHKLFGVFQRLHHQEEFSGTGIGLATAQRIVHRHGGRIWAEGALEKGATFFFTLPNLEGLTHG